jgi:hypothetical protein
MRSAGAAPISMALGFDPLGGIVIPVMANAGQGAERRLDVVPAGLVVERAPDQLGDEGAAPPATGAGIQLGDEVGLELNVHTHVSKSTHSVERELRRWRLVRSGCDGSTDRNSTARTSDAGADSLRSTSPARGCARRIRSATLDALPAAGGQSGAHRSMPESG